MIFRWTIWGMHTRRCSELLRISILSFRHQFGGFHGYYVCTDNIELIREIVGDISVVLDFSNGAAGRFDIESKATWKKWCPQVKLFPEQTEIYIDSDVFLVKYPTEINELIANPSIKFAIMDEFLGQPWQLGAMRRNASSNTPFVNAGLFIQKAGYDITCELEEQLSWWKENISKEEETHHDEQGALAIALTPHHVAGAVQILPKDKYLLIGPNENTELNNLEPVTLFHAVYPEHPAFYKFREDILELINTES